MEEREIAYERTAGYSVKFCPCCGAETNNRLACSACYDSEQERLAAAISSFDSQTEILHIRDWFYARGVELRAQGKLPALKKSELTYHDYRRGIEVPVHALDGAVKLEKAPEQRWGVWCTPSTGRDADWVHGGNSGVGPSKHNVYGSREEAERCAERMRIPGYSLPSYEVRPYTEGKKCRTCGGDATSHDGYCERVACRPTVTVLNDRQGAAAPKRSIIRSVAHLTWLRFVSNKAVRVFCEERSEGRPERLAAVKLAAFKCDQNGWATAAREEAKDMWAALEAGEKEPQE